MLTFRFWFGLILNVIFSFASRHERKLRQMFTMKKKKVTPPPYRCSLSFYHCISSNKPTNNNNNKKSHANNDNNNNWHFAIESNANSQFIQCISNYEIIQIPNGKKKQCEATGWNVCCLRPIHFNIVRFRLVVLLLLFLLSLNC